MDLKLLMAAFWLGRRSCRPSSRIRAALPERSPDGALVEIEGQLFTRANGHWERVRI